MKTAVDNIVASGEDFTKYTTARDARKALQQVKKLAQDLRVKILIANKASKTK